MFGFTADLEDRARFLEERESLDVAPLQTSHRAEVAKGGCRPLVPRVVVLLKRPERNLQQTTRFIVFPGGDQGLRKPLRICCSRGFFAGEGFPELLPPGPNPARLDVQGGKIREHESILGIASALRGFDVPKNSPIVPLSGEKIASLPFRRLQRVRHRVSMHRPVESRPRSETHPPL
jgi:hypothetical protein